MANERLRSAITDAGLEPDRLADLLEVDVKTVYRWISGRTPYTRHRMRLARALERSEAELWPETVAKAPSQDAGQEIAAAFARANDLGAPDWRELLKSAGERVDLLGFSLIDVLSTAGTIEALQAKAAAGCPVTVLIASPDSLWVQSVARQLGQDEEDYVGRSELSRDIELARGHLEPLIGKSGVEVRVHYAERLHRILRFDDQMLVTLHLWGAASEQAPLLYLKRSIEGGLFDQFAGQLQTVLEDVSEPLEADPVLYPDPAQNPGRYRPVTEEAYRQQAGVVRARSENELRSGSGATETDGSAEPGRLHVDQG